MVPRLLPRQPRPFRAYIGTQRRGGGGSSGAWSGPFFALGLLQQRANAGNKRGSQGTLAPQQHWCGPAGPHQLGRPKTAQGSIAATHQARQSCGAKSRRHSVQPNGLVPVDAACVSHTPPSAWQICSEQPHIDWYLLTSASWSTHCSHSSWVRPPTGGDARQSALMESRSVCRRSKVWDETECASCGRDELHLAG
eukprot:364943-Chlamydomonas_euryale.AAC.40